MSLSIYHNIEIPWDRRNARGSARYREIGILTVSLMVVKGYIGF